VSKVTVLSGPERRRRWTTAEKRRVVEESLALGASVIEVARRHDVHPNLLTVWRRQARTGAFGLASALPPEDEVQFTAVSVAPEPPSAWTARAEPGGTIEIAFANGVQLRITGAVDPATLTAAVAALSGGRAR
jgi:transposase